MSGDAAMLSRTWAVGSRTCTLTVPKPEPGAVLCASVEWDPDVPKRLSAAELNQYRAGRNAALADLAGALGITAAIVEV